MIAMEVGYEYVVKFASLDIVLAHLQLTTFTAIDEKFIAV